MKLDRRWRRAGVLTAMSLCLVGVGLLPNRAEAWTGHGHATLVVQKPEASRTTEVSIAADKPITLGLDQNLKDTFTKGDTRVWPPPPSKPLLPPTGNIFGPVAGIGVGVFLLGLALFIAAFKWSRLTDN